MPIALDALDLTQVGANAATWEKVVLKMRAGLMPPAGAPRPDKAAHDGFATWLESELDRNAAARPNPGRTEPFHRLNRAEYRNAVRDILDLDVDVASLLPADDVSYGFDNIAGVLKMSPTLMERYLAAAQKVSRLAVGHAAAGAEHRLLPRSPTICRRTSSCPDFRSGTRGGTLIRYTFPMDGVYEFRPRLTRDLNESVPLYTEEQQTRGQHRRRARRPVHASRRRRAPADAQPPENPEPQPMRTPNPDPRIRTCSANPEPRVRESQAQPARPAISQIQQTVRAGARERAARNRADESWNLRVPVKAGARDVVVTFLNSVSAIEETPRLPFERPFPAGVNIPETRRGAYLRSVEISGPHDPTWAGRGTEPQADLRLLSARRARGLTPTRARRRSCRR